VFDCKKFAAEPADCIKDPLATAHLSIFYTDKKHCFFFYATDIGSSKLCNFISFVKFLQAEQYNVLVYFVVSWAYSGNEYYTYCRANSIPFVILANTIQELNFYLDQGYQSIYCSQNTWLNYNFYTITDAAKEYDVVYNGRATPWKRHALLNRCAPYSKCFISYHDRDVKLSFFLPQAVHEDISPAQVAQVVNKSKIGIILSAEEGACYASSEYLLCGIPVISTLSRGGRDVFYTKHNSVVCVPDRQIIEDKIMSTLHNYAQYDKIKIRADHIKTQHFFLDNFSRFNQDLFIKHGIKKKVADILESFINSTLPVHIYPGKTFKYYYKKLKRKPFILF